MQAAAEQAYLNTQRTVNYRPLGWEGNRDVEMTGHAYGELGRVTQLLLGLLTNKPGPGGELIDHRVAAIAVHELQKTLPREAYKHVETIITAVERARADMMRSLAGRYPRGPKRQA